ncbi:hypothetical protein ABZW47_29505 [Streptomyces sp. NPDC004549]|uniref:hypothetical protein n=1 Tax=Streptomyces sp. NPDC004549 TaxID=3154283 RepID=UPI0033B6C0A0
MAGASSRIPPFRSVEYWAALETIADEFLTETAGHAQPSPDGARRTLKMLSSQGFGHLSLFDLCALLLLAVPRVPAERLVEGAPDVAFPVVPEPAPLAPSAGSTADLKRGPVTIAVHATERHVQHLRELEAAAAEALLISPTHPRARSTVRRALMARGSSIRDATAVYGIVCELIVRRPRAHS